VLDLIYIYQDCFPSIKGIIPNQIIQRFWPLFLSVAKKQKWLTGMQGFISVIVEW